MTPEVPSRLDSLCFYMDLGGRDFREKKKKKVGGWLQWCGFSEYYSVRVTKTWCLRCKGLVKKQTCEVSLQVQGRIFSSFIHS